MNDGVKIILSILLAVTFLVILAMTINIFVISFWLSNYFPYEDEALIATAVISPQESIDGGFQHQVSFSQSYGRNALSGIIYGLGTQESSTAEYTVRNNELALGVRTVEAHEEVVIFNFSKLFQVYLIGSDFVGGEYDAIWADLQDEPNVFNSPFFSSSSSSTPVLIIPESGGTFEAWIKTSGEIEWRIRN